ncbi:MAG: hypothetical protein ABSB41_03445 [Anaerolineales bacterium]|jgi:hypothetical protein
MIQLEHFHPHPALVTKTTLVEKPRFLAIDAHNHLAEETGGGWGHRPLPELLDLLVRPASIYTLTWTAVGASSS